MGGLLETRLDLVAPPEALPLALDATLYHHLRVDPAGDPPSHPDDALILRAIEAARDQCEQQETGRSLITSSWALWLAGWPSGRSLEIPRPPLQAVTAVAYRDPAGDWAEMTEGADYRVHCPRGPAALPGQIELVPGRAWPALERGLWPVRIDFVAGYGDGADAVPGGIRSWLQLLVGSLYAHRETTITGAIQTELQFAGDLLDPFRLPRIV